jgi:ectoine hydroxylase-related dioxygenase (phytanoyl-CoA dioxygenase family)
VPELLRTRDVARFVARGFLRFDALVPDTLNERFLQEVGSDIPEPSPAGTPLAECYAGSVVREILALPKVAGTVESLVGPDPLFDHQGVHFNPPASLLEAKGLRVMAQHSHQDSTIDPRLAFDVQLFYFPHEVTPEMGGTRYVPGTHLRVVSEMSIGRYQNIRGQEKVVCPAGTVMACHHGLWHGGEVNRSDRTRFMLKIRLNPTAPRSCVATSPGSSGTRDGWST